MCIRDRSYSYPERGDLVARLKILLATYVRAGGLRPILLMHDGKHGDSLISTMARQGRGLPANVLPMSLHSVMSLGHEVLSAGLAAGAERVVVLAPPDKAHEMPPLEAEVQLANTFASALGHGGPRVVVNAERDPEAVEAALHGLPALAAAPAGAIVVEGTKRDLARTALAHLRETGAARPERVPLPAGAPYGRIIVDVGGCTLCLSCAGACPTGAISDNPDRPQIAFNESACVQCGICVATCPEKVIRLEPRYDFTPAALSPVVVKGEEPFHCVECGKAFGTKATIDKVVARLKGHAMFADEARLRVIQMCDTCRVVAVANAADDPMRLGDRPRIRTTEDYVAAAAEAKRTGRKPEDFLD